MDTSIQYDKSQYQSTTSRVSDLLNEIHSLKQSRSNFALSHFVVCQHDMPGRQRMQVLDELEAALFSVYDMKDELDLAKINLDEIVHGEMAVIPDEWDAQRNVIKKNALQRKMVSIKMQIDSKTREMSTLLAILDTLPEYTREQIEAEEPEYWDKRLSRQAYLAQKGSYTGMGEGNLDAIMQIQDTPGAMNRISLNTSEVLNLIAAPTSAQSAPTTNLQGG